MYVYTYLTDNIEREIILCCTVQEGNQFLCNISLRFIVTLFNVFIHGIIMQEVKG